MCTEKAEKDWEEVKTIFAIAWDLRGVYGVIIFLLLIEHYVSTPASFVVLATMLVLHRWWNGIIDWFRRIYAAI